ncbi:MAG: AraC family transcriptional regulator [Pedobacter sp.]|uniref:helix-turn-helix domain-containing protein n=1 Tax=Pedobacter sp. TaxID=1411316 RepID=UPI0033945F13
MNEQKGMTSADIMLACIEEKYFQREILIERHAIVKILSGEMRVVQADKTYTFGAGDILLFPRNTLTTVIKYPKDGRMYRSVLMYISPERLQRYYAKNSFAGKADRELHVRTFKNHPLFESFFVSLMPYLEMADELPESIAAVKIEEAITILRTIRPELDALLSNFEDPGKLNMADFMERNYMFNLTLDKFCYLTGRSLTTFKKDFKALFHTTPQKWLTMKRLQLAHQEIKLKHRKPVEVYFEVGFENLSHFSFAFKKQYGYPPTAIPA